MDPDELAPWQSADALFDQWLDLPSAGRAAWLARLDAPAPVLHRLQQLIDAHERPRAGMDPAGGDLAGCQLGDWKLESELGRGGMAVVYRATREQGMARQQAAVKVLTLGALGNAGRERFHREAAILARLNHPNVTALVDSGVAEDGTCWLAMPLVDGQRIDEWCEAQSLDARAIVLLCLQVCDAVAYAHRNLVIHRDLKPSNVLVDRDGHVRLLDFGIGQFADAGGDRTHTMWRALTPGYAAPEQLHGAPPTTAMDIYGLGALLHRLLTGRTPAADGISHSTRPSLLVRDASDACHRHYIPLRNDLDRVLLKALAEDPEQRYPTAEAVADDLRRWLDGRPVLAEKPGFGYRARKFIARNKVSAAATFLLAASILGGAGATLWQAGEARRSADRAELEAANARVQAERAEHVRDFLERVFISTEPTSGGVVTALDMLEEGARLAREETMATEPAAAADILMLIGYARAHLSRYEEAARDLEDAQRLLRSHRPDARYELWRTHVHLAAINRTTGDTAAAIEHSRAAARITAQRDDATLDDRVFTLLNLGNALYAKDPPAAEQVYREALQLVPGTDLENGSRHLAAIGGLIATLAEQGEHGAEMLALMEEQLRLSRLIDGESEGAYAHTLASVSARLGWMPGQEARALELAGRSVELMSEIYSEPHYYRTGPLCNFGYQLLYLGRAEEAVAQLNAGIENAEAISAKDLGLVSCMRGRGYGHALLEQFEAARRDLESARLLASRLATTFGETDMNACGMEASVLIRQGKPGAAQDLLADCGSKDAPQTGARWQQARAELLFSQGDLAGAGEILAPLRRQTPPGLVRREWMRPWMLSVLLAHTSGDAAARSSLVAELGDFSTQSPLSECLAAPDPGNCLALP